MNIGESGWGVNASLREAYTADPSWAVDGDPFVVHGQMGVGANSASCSGLAAFLVMSEFLALMALSCAVVWSCLFHSAFEVEEEQGSQAQTFDFSRKGDDNGAEASLSDVVWTVEPPGRLGETKAGNIGNLLDVVC